MLPYPQLLTQDVTVLSNEGIKEQCVCLCIHVYEISSVVIAKQSLGEANVQLSILTSQKGHQIPDPGNPALATS